MDYKAIKAKAVEFVQTYNPEGLVPFPFERTAQQLGDVKIVSLQPRNDDISGAIYFENEVFIIVINSTKPEKRQYFTTAHEFGHYYIHSTWLKEHSKDNGGFVDYSNTLDGDSALYRPDTMPTSPEKIKREREANNFAAEILMPEDKLREFWDLSKDIEECASAFQVSNSAMAIRLERLNLL